MILFLTLSLTGISISTATIWDYGSLHQHTGYSTLDGYDGNPDTDYDDCPKEWFNSACYTVSELKAQA